MKNVIKKSLDMEKIPVDEEKKKNIKGDMSMFEQLALGIVDPVKVIQYITDDVKYAIEDKLVYNPDHKRALKGVEKNFGKKKRFRDIEKLDFEVKKRSKQQTEYLRILKQRKGNDILDIDEMLKRTKGVTEDQKEYIKVFLKMKVNDGKSITLPTKLIKDDVIVPFNNSLYLLSLSNDWLFLNFLMFYSINKFKEQYKKIMDVFELKSAKFDSDSAFKADGNVNIYYCEDFLPEVYANDYVELDTIERYNLLQSDSKTQMLLDGVLYDVLIKNERYLIYDSKKYADATKQLEEKLNKVKVFSLNKGELQNTLNKVTFKDEIVYVSVNIKPTKICTGNVVLPESQNINMLFKAKVKLDVLLQHIINNKEIPIIDDIFYWNSYKNMFEFYELLCFFAKENYIDKNIKYLDRFEAIVGVYKKIEDYFDLWRNHFENFRKIVIGFLDCFKTKVNIDKLNVIGNNVDLFISNDDYLISQKEQYRQLNTCIVLLAEGAWLMANFIFRDLRRDVVLSIQNVSEAIRLNDMESSELALAIRSCGSLVYSILYNGSTPMFMEIRSSAAFMGDLYGDYTNKEISNKIKQLIGVQKQELYEKNKKRDEKLRSTKEIVRLAKDLLRNTYRVLKLDESLEEKVLDFYDRSWGNNPAVSLALDEVIDMRGRQKMKDENIRNMNGSENLKGIIMETYNQFAEEENNRKKQMANAISDIKEGKEINTEKVFSNISTNVDVNEMNDRINLVAKNMDNPVLSQKVNEIENKKKEEEKEEEKEERRGRFSKGTGKSKYGPRGRSIQRSSSRAKLTTVKDQVKNIKRETIKVLETLSGKPYKFNELATVDKRITPRVLQGVIWPTDLKKRIKNERDIIAEDPKLITDIYRELFLKTMYDDFPSIDELKKNNQIVIPAYKIEDDDRRYIYSEKYEVGKDNYVPGWEAMYIEFAPKYIKEIGLDYKGIIIPIGSFLKELSRRFSFPAPDKAIDIFPIKSKEFTDFYALFSPDFGDIYYSDNPEFDGLYYSPKLNRLFPLKKILNMPDFYREYLGKELSKKKK